MKVVLGVLVVLAIAGGAVAYRWHDGFADRPKFRTQPVMRGDLFVGVTASGTVEPVEIIDVGAQIIGSVTSFGPDPDHPGKTIDYRSRVEKNGILAQLDDLPHRAELDMTCVNLQLAEAQLKQSVAKQKQAHSAFEREKALRATDSKADYEKAEADDEMAQAETAMSAAKVDQAKIAKKQSEINLAYTTIRSPVDGVVIDRRVNIGQTVVAGLNAPSLFLLAKDISRMLVWSAVNEADIGEIKVGQTVKFTVDAYRDRVFTGKVSQVRYNASLQTSIVTYGVIVDVDNADGKLLPYMTAKVKFEVANRKAAVLVPNQALRWQPTRAQISPSIRYESKAALTVEGPQGVQEDGSADDAEPRVDLGSPTVWMVARDGFVHPVSVTVGLSDGMATEILSGEMQPGDTVVTGVVKKDEPDFVSSFVSKVTDSNK